jgi:hypothetical protein
MYAAVPTASWVSTGVFEAKGVNPNSKSRGRKPKAVDGVILLIRWHPLQLCSLQTYWLGLYSVTVSQVRGVVQNSKWTKIYHHPLLTVWQDENGHVYIFISTLPSIPFGLTIHELGLDPHSVLARLAVSSVSMMHGVDMQREVLDSGLSPLFLVVCSFC